MQRHSIDFPPDRTELAARPIGAPIGAFADRHHCRAAIIIGAASINNVRILWIDYQIIAVIKVTINLGPI